MRVVLISDDDVDALERADFVVLDLQGAESVLEDERLQRIPFVALANSADDPAVQRAYALGARACFVKPVAPEFLHSVVEVLGAAVPALRSRTIDDVQQFAYAASHDLQEPLRMVASFTQLLGDRYRDVLDDRGRQYIDFAQDGAKRMRRLIADLLAYSRIQTQGEPLQPVDAAACLQRALRALPVDDAIVEHAIEARVLADEEQLQLLFHHLLANALAFRREAAPHVRVSARREGARFVFTVRDDGIGVPPEYTERVFGLFERLQARDGHTGIGLALCRRIVDRHGGTIHLESDGETGTTVVFTLRASFSS